MPKTTSPKTVTVRDMKLRIEERYKGRYTIYEVLFSQINGTIEIWSRQDLPQDLIDRLDRECKPFPLILKTIKGD